MNKYSWIVIAAVVGSFVLVISVGLRYSQSSIFFGLVAAILSPIVIHKIPQMNVSLGLLVGLSFFASFPLKKLFQFEGILQEVSISAAYLAVLWVIGFGWRRSWR